MLNRESVIFIFIVCCACAAVDAKLKHRTTSAPIILVNDTGLSFYDLETNEIIEPPFVTLHLKQRRPQRGRPCSCTNLNCGCCAGVNFKRLNFRRQSKCYNDV